MPYDLLDAVERAAIRDKHTPVELVGYMEQALLRASYRVSWVRHIPGMTVFLLVRKLSPPSGCHSHPRCPYTMPRCREIAPPLEEIAPGRWSACYLNNTAA